MQVLLRVLLVALLSLSCAAHAAGQTGGQDDPVEREIAAAYLYKFASYIEWPEGTFASDHSPMVIGVVGAGRLADAVAKMVAGKTANGRPLVVRKLRGGEAVDGVHILFVGRMGHDATAATFAAAQGRPVLIVSASPQARALGSMINLVMVDRRLRFEVALRPAARNGIRFSALMLTAAYAVAQESP